MPSSFFTPVTAQEPAATAIEAFEKIKDSFALLSEGRVSTYGAYIAGAKSKKIVYMLGMDVLSVGLETKMQVTRLSGKSKNLPAEKLAADDVLGVAIFKIKASTKDYVTITKHPAAHENAHSDHRKPAVTWRR